MKRVLQFALAAMMFLAACSKEDETPPPLIQEQEVSVSASVELEADALEINKVPDDYITLEEARKDLESILADFSTLSKSGKDGFPSRKIADGFSLKSVRHSLSKSTAEPDTTQIHVFNFEDDNGFAIMSATRAMPSLLAITEGGNIDTNQVLDNPGLIIFLSNLETACVLAKQRWIEEHKDDFAGGDTVINTSSTTLSKKVPLPKIKLKIEYSDKFYNPQGGYCKVHWHQNDPFNGECYNKNDSLAPVGCVAVACGQLMSIYKYPKLYQNRTLHWDDMLVNEHNKDIAWLLRRLGDSINLRVEYGSVEKHIGSSGKSSRIPDTFVNFGYSNGGMYIDYNENEICRELKNRYPVLLGGYSIMTSKSYADESVFGIKCSTTSYSRGHQWLAHGLLERTETIYRYKDDDDIFPITKSMVLVSKSVKVYNYILCNFGWGENPKENGYYLSGVFDTNEGGKFSENTSVSKAGTPYYYRYALDAVINIRK